MKKGFTLIEIIVALVIICIFVAITTLNFARLSKSSKIESYSNEISALLRDAYENASKEMDYDKWSVEVKRTGDRYFFELKGDNAQKGIELVNTDVLLKNDNTTLTFVNNAKIMFSPNGNIIINFNDGTEIENENLYIEIYDRNNQTLKKIIEINSVPPGNIKIK